MVYAVTSLHVGVGRSGGVVDLPIQRDPMGFPVVFSSSFKGALKQFCALRLGAAIDDNSGRINCSDDRSRVCCCLLGGEGDATEAASLLGLSDLYPLAIPVPSLDRGYIYLTSKYLIETVTDLFQAVGYDDGVGWLKSLLDGVKNPAGEATVGIDLRVPLVKPVQSGFLSTLVGLGLMAGKLVEGVAVEVDDTRAVIEIERGVIKYTRNKIDYRTGTVAQGALWTEEYLPHGTILAGVAFFNVPRRNKYCGDGVCDEGCAMKVFNAFMSDNEFYMNVGGKETIGRGIVKVRLLR